MQANLWGANNGIWFEIMGWKFLVCTETIPRGHASCRLGVVS